MLTPNEQFTVGVGVGVPVCVGVKLIVGVGVGVANVYWYPGNKILTVAGG